MRLAGNIGRAIGGAGGGGGDSSARGANGVVKFRLFCGGARQSSYKAGCWIVGFLTHGMSMVQ